MYQASTSGFFKNRRSEPRVLGSRQQIATSIRRY